jgi:hypothetical protein
MRPMRRGSGRLWRRVGAAAAGDSRKGRPGDGAATRRAGLLALLALPLGPALGGCAGGLGGGDHALVPVGQPVVRSDTTGGLAEGRIKNTGNAPRTGAVAVTLFDAGGKEMAVLRGPVPSVAPGTETSYRATGGPVGAWARAEVRVTAEGPG